MHPQTGVKTRIIIFCEGGDKRTPSCVRATTVTGFPACDSVAVVVRGLSTSLQLYADASGVWRVEQRLPRPTNGRGAGFACVSHSQRIICACQREGQARPQHVTGAANSRAALAWRQHVLWALRFVSR